MLLATFAVPQPGRLPTLLLVEDHADTRIMYAEYLSASFDVLQAADAYEAEVKRAVEKLVIDNLMSLAARAEMPQVRAIALHHLDRRSSELARMVAATNGSEDEADTALAAHRSMLARDVGRFLENPVVASLPAGVPAIPPGAPIDPGMDWLGVFGPPCSWQFDR